MEKLYLKRTSRISIVLLFLFLITRPVFSCTIVSAVASNGQVWNLNNEDGPFGIANFINVFPKAEDKKYGYYTFSYGHPEDGNNSAIQGGMNEAGLTFDFNAIDEVKDFDTSGKKAFPNGDDAILPHILGNMSTTQEVLNFFETYWFENGFRSAQMHIADKTGTFAIISASGVKVVEKGPSLVSTNFDICGKEDSSACWRYPIAKEKLSNSRIGLMAMLSIALETAQKNGATRYSNIQNLSTGEIWLFTNHDPDKIIHITIADLLSKGNFSYTFSDLESLLSTRPNFVRKEYAPVILLDEVKAKYIGEYQNYAIGTTIVKPHENGLEIFFPFGQTAVFQPIAEKRFYFPEATIFVEFATDVDSNQLTLKVSEKNFWLFTGWKEE